MTTQAQTNSTQTNLTQANPTSALPAFSAHIQAGVYISYRLPHTTAQALLPAGIEAIKRGDFAYAHTLVLQLNSLSCQADNTIQTNLIINGLSAQFMTQHADIITGLWPLACDITAENDLIKKQFKNIQPNLLINQAQIAIIQTREHTIVDAQVDAQATHLQANQLQHLKLRIGTTRPTPPKGSSFATLPDANAFCRIPQNWITKPQTTASTNQHTVNRWHHHHTTNNNNNNNTSWLATPGTCEQHRADWPMSLSDQAQFEHAWIIQPGQWQLGFNQTQAIITGQLQDQIHTTTPPTSSAPATSNHSNDAPNTSQLSPTEPASQTETPLGSLQRA